MPGTISIHVVEGAANLTAFFHLAAQTFMRDVPPAVGAADWQRCETEHPLFHHSDLRGAFRDGIYTGGYIIEERPLRLGAATVPAGRIGGVVTHPDHRRQGIGQALMRDALAHARARGLALLLLNGAPHFYDPFGYIDIFDRTEHLVARADISAQPPSPYRVRRATAADAPALLSLYRRHYGPYAGGYDRTLSEQEYLVRFGHTVDRSLYTWRGDIAYDTPVLAVNAEGQPRGYLAVPWGPLRSFGCEVACDDWPAALALLQHHAGQLAVGPGTPDHLRWPLPATAAAYYAIASHLPVLSESRSRPHAGWMAYIVDVPALARWMLPQWQARWQRCSTSWWGALTLTVEGDVLGFVVDTMGIRLSKHTPEEAARAHISRSVLTQLLFGYRPVSWAAGQAGQSIPPDLVPVLEVLFPARQAWIAPTDGC